MDQWKYVVALVYLVLLGTLCVVVARADDPDYYNPTFESDETATTLADPIVLKDNAEDEWDWIEANPLENDVWAVYTEDDKLIRILKSSGVRCEYVDEL